MTWLHNETTVLIERQINTSNNISSFTRLDVFYEGHFKKVNVTDPLFDITNIDGTAYKLSIKGAVDIREGDRVIIENGPYAGTYSVQDTRYTQGLYFNTSKILCIK